VNNYITVPAHLTLVRLNELDQETVVHYVIGRNSELTSLKAPKHIYKSIYKNIANSYYDYIMSMQQYEEQPTTALGAGTDPAATATTETHETTAIIANMTDEMAYYHMYSEYYQHHLAEPPVADSCDTPVFQSADTNTNTISQNKDDSVPEEPDPFPELKILETKLKLIGEADEGQMVDTAHNSYSAYYQYILEQTAALEHAYNAAMVEQEEAPRMSTWLGRTTGLIFARCANPLQAIISKMTYPSTMSQYRTTTLKSFTKIFTTRTTFSLKVCEYRS